MPHISVNSIWKRIEAWLAARVSKKWLSSPGLSESAICDAEKAIGHKLPLDLREFYKIHNGLPGLDIAPGNGTFGCLLPLLPTKKRWVGIGKRSVIDSWQLMTSGHAKLAEPNYWAKPKGPIAKVMWTPDWVPIFDNIQGDYVVMDMNPPKGGIRGQMIDYWRLEGPRNVVAKSFQTWLSRFATELKNDRYRVEVSKFGVSIMRKTYWKKMQSVDRKNARLSKQQKGTSPTLSDSEMEAFIMAMRKYDTEGNQRSR